MTTLATFNANNFFLRYRFSNRYPGDRSGISQVEATEVATVGYVPQRHFGNYGSNHYIVWDVERRRQARFALEEPDGQLPDILCLQEVENIHAIRILNERYLDNHYQYSLLIDAYDTRNIDVGVLSTRPITRVRSHIDYLDANDMQPFYSRDCLEFDVLLPDGETLAIFNNHLKSKYSESTADLIAGHQRRLLQARRITELIDERFQGAQNSALYAIVGDLNDTPESPWLEPLMNTPRLTDILSEYRALDDRWTYYWRSRNRVTQIDHILASRALAERIEAQVNANAARTPYIERAGLGFRELNASGEVLPREANLVHYEDDAGTPADPNATPDSRVNFRFPRYERVLDNWRNNISDHCPVKVWL